MSKKNKHSKEGHLENANLEEQTERVENCDSTVQQNEELDDSSCHTDEEESKADKESPCSAEEAALEELRAQVLSLEGKLAESQDRYLRLTAEFDNHRKRTLRERTELISRASGETLEQLLPVVDDFDRAIVSARESDNLEALLEGLEIIRKNLNSFLKKQGVTEIESIGKELNTDFHHAITTTPVEDKKQKGKIVDVIKKGYLLNGSVLRHAEVVVGQ